MFSFMLWVVDLVLWLSCHKTTKKRSMIPQQKNNLEMIHDSCHTGEVTPSYSVAFGCYLISFEWRNTVLNSSCWLLLLSSEFKLELIYAQETLSRSPLTSIENMNSQNQQKQSITQNSSKFQKLWDNLKGMLFRHRNVQSPDKQPMSPQDCQSATGGKKSRIRQSFFGQSIQISSAAGAPSHRGCGLSNSNYDRIYDDKNQRQYSYLSWNNIFKHLSGLREHDSKHLNFQGQFLGKENPF